MNLIKLLLRMFFGHGSSAHKHISTIQSDEKVIASKARQELAQAAREEVVEETEKKIVRKLEDEEKMLGSLLEKGITSETQKGLIDLAKNVGKYITDLVKDEVTLDAAVDYNAQALSVSIAELKDTLQHLKEIEKNIKSIKEEEPRRNCEEKISKLTYLMTELFEEYNQSQRALIKDQQVMLRKSSAVLNSMRAAYTSLIQAISSRNTEQAKGANDRIEIATKEFEEYVKQLENLSKNIFNFNEKTAKMTVNIMVLLQQLDKALAENLKTAA